MLISRLLRPSTTARSLTQTHRIESQLRRIQPFSSQWRLQEQKLVEEDLPHLPDIDPSKLEVTKSITPKELVPNQDLVFGRTFTGKSLRCDEATPVITACTISVRTMS